MRISSTFVLVTCLVVTAMLPACGGGGRGNQAPSVVVTAPAEDVEVGLTLGGTVEIRYRDEDPDDVASTDLLADRDGDPGTTDDQVAIALARPERDGAGQSVIWDVAGVPAGTYRILARTADAVAQALGEAPGRALLNAGPSLTITQPAADAVVSRGASVDVEYVDDDPDDGAITVLFADQDGDPATTHDARDITRWLLDGDGAVQQVVWDTRGVPQGDYHVLGQTWDGTNPPVLATAPGRIGVRNVAWAARAGGVDAKTLGKAVARAGNGGLAVAGILEGDATFGTGAGEVSVSSGETVGGFVARYSADGVFLWARDLVGSENLLVEGVAGFADGSCIIAGSFTGQVTFGEGLAAVTLGTAGDWDAFVARYAVDGSLVWAKQAGGTSDDLAQDVAARADGGFVVTGIFQGSATFGEGLSAVTMTALGGDDAFLARYLANGTLLWAKQAAGADDAFGRATAVCPDGDVLMVGHFADRTSLSQGLGAVTLTAAGDLDAFLVRYAPDGTVRWAARAGQTSYVAGTGVAARPDGSCVLAGYFAGAATFGDGVGAPTLVTDGGDDAYVASYAPDGTLEWARRVGGGADARANDVDVLPDGSCAVVGPFDGVATFGGGALTLTSGGDFDVFLARFDIDGEVLWARRAGGGASCTAHAVVALPDSSFAFTGFVRGTAIFGHGAYVLATEGERDLFVARCNADGDF